MNFRLLALMGAVACAMALPLALACADPVGGEDSPAARDRSAGPAAGPAAVRDLPTGPPGRALPGLGAAAARCGPETVSPGGVEAQTCVMARGAETWARTYYRNATGSALEAVLSLMGPGNRTAWTRCAVGAGDEPASCETARERTRGGPADYSAVAEFAERGGGGPLLLRSGV